MLEACKDHSTFRSLDSYQLHLETLPVLSRVRGMGSGALLRLSSGSSLVSRLFPQCLPARELTKTELYEGPFNLGL